MNQGSEKRKTSNKIAPCLVDTNNIAQYDRERDTEDYPRVASVKLKENKNCIATQLFMQPQDQNGAADALTFKTDHFFKMDQQSEASSKQTEDSVNTTKVKKCVTDDTNSKLPLVVELVAGVGSTQQSMEQNKSLMPSEMIVASASFLKSYIGFSQDKRAKNVTESEESIKEKAMSLWSNMKYGWSANMKTNFSKDATIYLLGKAYHKSFKEDIAYDGSGFTCSNLEGFKKDFKSLSWFTYRRKFPVLPNSSLTSDCGWGCMIRSGQMMMATALAKHFLPPGWRYISLENDPQSSIHRQIMKWFCDSPSNQCPFSIHKMVSLGHKMNKKAGNWYGPSCMSHMLKEAVTEGSKTIPALDRVTVYVAQDGAVYIQDVLDACSAGKCICYEGAPTEVPLTCDEDSLHKSLDNLSCGEPYSVITKFEEKTYPVDLFVNSNRNVEATYYSHLPAQKSSPSSSEILQNEICQFCHEWRSCLILIPVRLGGSHVNPIYYNSILSLFIHDLCIGIIGGSPKHSLYFVGYQEDSLIHLDPHFSQDAVHLEEPLFPLHTYHCSSPKKIPLSNLDPSATIGFYCHTKSQFFRLMKDLSSIASSPNHKIENSIFEFVNGSSSDMSEWLHQTLDEESARIDVMGKSAQSLEESEVLNLD